jgi:hypothetical protein
MGKVLGGERSGYNPSPLLQGGRFQGVHALKVLFINVVFDRLARDDFGHVMARPLVACLTLDW